MDEVVKVGVCIIDVLFRVIGYALCSQQLAIGVIYRYDFVRDEDLAAILVNDGLLIFHRGLMRLLWFFRLRIWFFSARRVALVNFNRAVPLGVGKQAGDVAEVHDGEMGFALFLPDAGTASHNLLEFCHRVNALIKHNQFHHLAINAS